MVVDENEVHPQGEAILQELLWIHNIIRTHLETIATVIKQITEGAEADEVRARINELASNSIVWRLRVHCLQYCQLVHGHHHHEDVGWFPTLRRIDPALDPVIDKLEADHALVSTLLDEVEAAAQRLPTDEAARADLAKALRWLGEHLLAHLEYEETNLAPTLRRLRRWPPS